MRPTAHTRRILLASLLAGFLLANAGAQDDIGALARAYNASALYREFAGKPGNIVFSPYSIGTAMAMARSGARGETERQMAAVLRHGKSREDIDRANAALLAVLNAYDTTSRPDYCPKETRWTGKRCEGPPLAERRCTFPARLEGEVCVGRPSVPAAKLLTANALMLTKYEHLISSEYRNVVRKQYAAEIYERADLEQVNDWVRRKTEGKIDRILNELDPDSAAVLLNAVYFKAAWASIFPKRATREGDFKLTAAQTVRVPLMRQEASFRLAEGPGYRAIRLDYTQRAFGMIVVLPEEAEGLDAVTRKLEPAELAKLLASLSGSPETLVSLALPRFKTAFEADLVGPFRKAGMMLAFTDNADFSGMGGDVKISQIRHRATIEVAEEGTEASGATAVEMSRKSIAPKRPTPVPFVVDRPFLFYVVDDASGAILFQGRIVDPRPR